MDSHGQNCGMTFTKGLVSITNTCWRGRFRRNLRKGSGRDKLNKERSISSSLYLIPYAHRILMRLQSFQFGEYLYSGAYLLETFFADVLKGYFLDKRIYGYARIRTGIARRRQGVIRTGCVISCTFGSQMSEKDRSRIAYFNDQGLPFVTFYNEVFRSVGIGKLHGFYERFCNDSI